MIGNALLRSEGDRAMPSEASGKRLRREVGGTWDLPFLVHPELADSLASAHLAGPFERDPIPALHPASWGRFAHIGREYHFAEGARRSAEPPVQQMADAWAIRRFILNLLAPQRRQSSARWSLAEHAPHHYVAGLRPACHVSEFGD